MVGLVQLANKKVIKYNIEGKEIHIYNSVNECLEDIKISGTTLRNKIRNNENINGFYYLITQNVSYKVVKCEHCGKEFNCQKSRINIHSHLFCSKKCEGEWRKANSEKNCICAYCGKQFHRKESHIKHNIKNYCCSECSNKDKKIRYSGKGNHQYGLKGSLNTSWKSNERISVYGYKLIRQPKHPFKNSDDFVFEHRLIAEKYLLNETNSVEINGQKYLNPDFVVHHIDFNRLNNDTTNLIIMRRNEHTRLHKSLKEKEDYKNYCIKYGVSYEIVIRNHSYNKKYYTRKIS